MAQSAHFVIEYTITQSPNRADHSGRRDWEISETRPSPQSPVPNP
jgi:hypothetical protein